MPIQEQPLSTYMEVSTLFIIAIGLSLDSFAISLTNGFTIRPLGPRQILTISLCLTVFQSLMPLIGWLAGMGLRQYIMAIDHWIAFGLLTAIGLKMIYDGTKRKFVKQEQELKILTLIGQSIATSVDALVVGISLAFINGSIFPPIIIIGLITFVFSITGLYLGKLYQSVVVTKFEVAGGLILIGIGITILTEHIL